MTETNESIFHLQAPFAPTGDQPQAIEALTRGVLAGCVLPIGHLRCLRSPLLRLVRRGFDLDTGRRRTRTGIRPHALRALGRLLIVHASTSFPLFSFCEVLPHCIHERNAIRQGFSKA